MKKTVLVLAAVALGAAALAGRPSGGTADAGAADPDRVAARGLELQQQARVTGDPTLYPRAERELRRALRLDPANGQAVRGLAAVAASRHRFDEALPLARRALRLEPGSAAAHGLLGDALLELGRYPEAFAAYDRMAALKPTAGGYARISYARELLGDTEGAIEAMQLAVDASIGVAEPSAWSRTLLAQLVLGAGREDEAEALLREALAFRPGYPAALAGLAELATRRGDLGTALAQLRRAAAASSAPEYAAGVGDTLAALGRDAEAERAWARAEELERLFAANGGNNLLETAELDLNRNRNLRSALERARRGRALRPSVEGDHVLAWALYRNGRCGEARAASLRSLRLGTLDVDGLWHHSLIERCLGNEAAAAEYRRRVHRLDPTYLERATG